MKNLLAAAALLIFGLTGAQNSLLWKVSGNGLQQPSYVFGTIHITCDATLDKPVLDALEKTDQLYLELDMDDPGMQTAMMSGMMMKDGKTMKSLVSEENFKLIDDYMKEKLGMSVLMMNTMKPFVVSMMFLPSMLDCPMQSVETELLKKSKEQNEEVFGLETVAEQMAVFDAIPYDVQMEELVKSIRTNFADDKEELNRMMALYQARDLDGLARSIEKSDNKITSDHQEALLFNRNRNWIPRMEKIMKEKPTFFGVGAGHLPGQEGVLDLLRKRGYKVEAVQ